MQYECVIFLQIYTFSQKCVCLLPVSFPCFLHGIPRLCSAFLLTFRATQAPLGLLLIYFMERAIKPVTFPSSLSFNSRPHLCVQFFWFLNPSSALVVPFTLSISFSPAAEVLDIPELVLIQPEESFHLSAWAPSVSIPVRESMSIISVLFSSFIKSLRIQKITV